MAAASSSSDDSQIKHDVFISFCGKDTRRGFLSHLVKELRREKIIVFVDENLNRGEGISSSLRRAIQESQISIVIFSENYASSSWCLDELAEIIKCVKVNKQIVLPVFYCIDPSHVRHQKGTYENAFADHELKFQGNGLKVQNWRSALKNAADLSGYVSSIYDNDSELIDEIVKYVLSRLEDVLLSLDHIYPNESEGLVGIDQQLYHIRSFLEMKTKEVQILGIWGMSGIGKTTIAQVAYDKFSSHYEGSCFIDNVREESQNHSLKYLKKKLISELQEENSTFVHIGFISRRKVLVVLDDVGTLEQLQYLVTKGICWGPGSRIIVTSNNKQALIAGGVHAIHEVKELNFEESLKLFSLKAFKKSHPEKGYEELSKKAVAYAKGLPLALKVLGLCLYSRDRKTWKDTMRKLEMYPHPQIQDVLKMCLDGLDDIERDIFLDIAFFYKGEDKDHVIRLLHANNLFPDCGIKVLLDKALISISNDNIIQMHDLIQEMGWEIVRQECKENPGKRSRLKDFEEVYDVLKNKKGTDAIKGIALYASLFKHVQLNVDTFKNMTNLRVAKFYSPWHVRSCNVNRPTSFESFADELRSLEWDGYPFKSLALSFYPEKLVGHSLPNSHVEELWKLVEDYAHCKRIILGRSKQSMQLLDFSKAQKIQWDDICACGSSCNVSPHILSFSMIAALNLAFSKDSKTVHSERNFRALRDFDVGVCFNVKVFSLSAGEISESDLGASKFEMLYSSIGGLSEILPINESRCLRSFEELSFSYFRQMNRSSDYFSLSYLNMNESSIDSSPASIKNIPFLKTICLRNCRRLRSIPERPQSVMHLDATTCTSLKTVLTITASRPQQKGILSYCFSFVNCLKLDDHSLFNIMHNDYLSLKRAVHNNFKASVFCYLSSRVPKWFEFKQATEASITMPFSPAINELLGFVFWAVLRQFNSNEMCPAYLKCLCYFEDGEKLEGSSTCGYPITELYSDHVFLWHDPLYSKSLVEGVKKRLGKSEVVPKVSFRFYVVTYDGDNGEMAEHECLVKKCGVRPIYASGQQTELAPELKMKSKWGLDKPGSFKGRIYSRKRKNKDLLTTH
ncbi:hypothetical protein QN277_019562 [Acacia crassicarpa]|uniref:TIR domain-containing protein n=1 Tax=Acacia crassicarpa TaxID=499986 RepID=A0AAE1JHR0_9FABA|nr:hypothetical protein QN277_019562 [Acacia crassicarpa]